MFSGNSCKEQFYRNLPLYFKDNFEGKFVHEAVCKTFKKEVFLLTQTYVRFGMLHTALVAIKEQESENLSLVLSNLLDEYIKRVDVICKQLKSILEQIANELNVTIS